MTPAQHAAISQAIGLEHLLLVGRGTTALWAALRAMLPERAEVLVPADACEVVSAAVRFANMTPRYVDVDPIGGNCSVSTLERAWTPACQALIAIHNYGTPLEMKQILPWARSRSLVVIEDCCNALGATRDGQAVGTFGDVAVYSFGRGKILDLGSGGLLASNDKALVERCRRLCAVWRSWGDGQRQRDRAFQECLRVIRRHTELRDPAVYELLYARYLPALLVSAAEGTAERIAGAVVDLAANIERRRERAARCRKRLADERVLHREPVGGDVYWRYTCHVPRDDRDRVVAAVRQKGLPISTWFSVLQRFFPTRQSPATLEGAYTFEKTVINLFVGSDTDDTTLDASLDAVLTALDGGNGRGTQL